MGTLEQARDNLREADFGEKEILGESGTPSDCICRERPE